MVTEFFMPMKVPTTTHQQKQVRVLKGKPVFYEPDDLQAARSKLMAYLGQHVPEKPFSGPVRMITKWCFPIKGKHYNGEWKTTKPDVTNLMKLFEDVMTDLGYWKDDALIVSEITEKFWAELPGIYVRIDSLESE
ncbi:RusA family crossover junction endodeoxyribonuclease [Sporolactobacillus shoreae]|uniref:RusA family crossover junction endodeoxyribonuclease n=1 Tax=Sporolactobacillus shoreae TaxID=1465501 RepID=A0A4Z0GJH5_9BACL|nr:RusA family crossover junction endodeoxyribonuclease [Sporolactobacillus shoreae]TGA95628.1 RusA family crossover junction endodeoxyribonuclease [Sporolactobacillus shoreae]